MVNSQSAIAEIRRGNKKRKKERKKGRKIDRNRTKI